MLLDVEMTGMSGYQVLRVMQTEPALAGIPVIFLSGRVSADDVATGLRLGAHDYLRKPVEPDELLARVSAALRTKLRQDELKRDVAALREVAPIDAGTGLLDATALSMKIGAWPPADGGDDQLLGGVLLVVEGLDVVTEARGEEAAEEVVRKVADAVCADLRGGDVIGRTGQGELLALLPDSDRTSALAVAKRLRDVAERTPVVLGDTVVTVSVSTGVAVTAGGDREAFVRDLQTAVVESRRARLSGLPAAAPPPPPPPSDPSIDDLRAASEGRSRLRRFFRSTEL